MKLITYEEVLNRFKIIHKNKYNYKYFTTYNKNYKSKIIIICPIHGEFTQNLYNHLQGRGCPLCCNNKRSTTIEFTTKAIKVHGNIYDYSLVIYKNWKTKVSIICPAHGIFKQTPNNHLNGQKCPKCNDKNNSLGVLKIDNYLNENNIEYKKEYKFDRCINKKPLPFDYYIIKQNLCIEYDGEQHTRGWCGDKNSLQKIQQNDQIKTKYCIDNNIQLLRIDHNQINDINTILKSTLK